MMNCWATAHSNSHNLSIIRAVVAIHKGTHITTTAYPRDAISWTIQKTQTKMMKDWMTLKNNRVKLTWKITTKIVSYRCFANSKNYSNFVHLCKPIKLTTDKSKTIWWRRANTNSPSRWQSLAAIHRPSNSLTQMATTTRWSMLFKWSSRTVNTWSVNVRSKSSRRKALLRTYQRQGHGHQRFMGCRGCKGWIISISFHIIKEGHSMDRMVCIHSRKSEVTLGSISITWIWLISRIDFRQWLARVLRVAQ